MSSIISEIQLLRESEIYDRCEPQKTAHTADFQTTFDVFGSQRKMICEALIG